MTSLLTDQLMTTPYSKSPYFWCIISQNVDLGMKNHRKRRKPFIRVTQFVRIRGGRIFRWHRWHVGKYHLLSQKLDTQMLRSTRSTSLNYRWRKSWLDVVYVTVSNFQQTIGSFSHKCPCLAINVGWFRIPNWLYCPKNS